MKNSTEIIPLHNALINFDKQIAIGEKLLKDINNRLILIVNKNFEIKIVNYEKYKSILDSLKENKLIKNPFFSNLISITLIENTFDNLLFFTTNGKFISTTLSSIINIKDLKLAFNLTPNDSLQTVLSLNKETENLHLVFLTKYGIIKKTQIKFFLKQTSRIKSAIKLKKDDFLLDVKMVQPHDIILIGSKNGRVIKFMENRIKELKLDAFGQKIMTLDKDDNTIGLSIINHYNYTLFFITSNYYMVLLNLIDEFGRASIRFVLSKGIRIVKPNPSDYPINMNIGTNNDTFLVITNKNKISDLKIPNFEKTSMTYNQNIKKEKIVQVIKLPNIEYK